MGATPLTIKPDNPAEWVHKMLESVLYLAGLGVKFQWADLGDMGGHWTPAEIDRVLSEFRLLCEGRGDETAWEDVAPARPVLRIV